MNTPSVAGLEGLSTVVSIQEVNNMPPRISNPEVLIF
jgi:hypothetical protein